MKKKIGLLNLSKKRMSRVLAGESSQCPTGYCGCYYVSCGGGSYEDNGDWNAPGGLESPPPKWCWSPFTCDDYCSLEQYDEPMQ